MQLARNRRDGGLKGGKSALQPGAGIDIKRAAKLCHQAIEWYAINGQMMLGIAKECRHVKDPLCG